MAIETSQLNPNEPIRIAFLEIPHARATDPTKDNRFVNGYFEPIKNHIKNKLDFFFIKRPGLSQNVRPSGTTGTGRGVTVWNGNIYSVVGTKIYKGTTDLGVTLTTSSGLCKFEIIRPGAGTPRLCVNDGVRLYAITSGDVVTTVTTNFPNPNTRDLVNMDTYLFTLDSSANLFNCNADDPTTWVASNFITAQMLPGSGKGIVKIQNLMYVFTDRHMQGFYNAANTSGSPLSNAEQYMRRVGCVSNDTIGTAEEMVFWVGANQDSGHTVWKMASPGQPENIGTPTINRIIDLEGTNLSSARAILFRHAGHLFYVLTLIGANRTFVYDPSIDLWFEWTDTSGSSAWPIVATAEYQNGVIGQHSSNGWIYNISSNVYQDDGVNFTVTARTPRLDFDTMRRKFVNRVDIVADAQSSIENVTLSYSDDDYQTFSTARTYDISKVRNFGRAWGNFRRRSWQLQYSGNQAFRALGLEFDIVLE